MGVGVEVGAGVSVGFAVSSFTTGVSSGSVSPQAVIPVIAIVRPIKIPVFLHFLFIETLLSCSGPICISLSREIRLHTYSIYIYIIPF